MIETQASNARPAMQSIRGSRASHRDERETSRPAHIYDMSLLARRGALGSRLDTHARSIPTVVSHDAELLRQLMLATFAEAPADEVSDHAAAIIACLHP
jgi:hypothetical protein